MSEPYQLYVLLPEPVAATDAVPAVHKALLSGGACLTADCLHTIAADEHHDDSVPEPVSSSTPEEVIAEISASPHLGLVEYVFSHEFISVGFLNERAGPWVDCIVIGFPARSFDRQAAGHEAMAALGRHLHSRLRAGRCVLGWGLSAGGFCWIKELHEIRAGRYPNSHPMLDLH